jgi:peptidyl-Lys metalloendopeptidase
MSTKLVRCVARVAVVGLMVGFGVVAWATGPKGQADGTMALRFDAKTCSAEERASVNEAFALARERTAAGLQATLANRADPRLARWFGDGSRDRVVVVLQSVLRQLDHTDNFTIGCSSTAYCVQNHPMAYTSFGDHSLGFCAGFFSASLTGEDSRFGAVIHELTHLAARTQDYAYGRPNATTLALKQGARAADNADSYEYFCETLRE